MHTLKRIASIAAAAALTATLLAAQAQPKGPGRGRGNAPPRQDMTTYPRPFDGPDTVWIEDMTLPEVRDALKAGKNTALIFSGGMEDNGPYITVSQHNVIVKAMCGQIAKTLGNALCAPVVGIAPGSPERSKSPGSVSLTAETFKNVLLEEATSLQSQGFKYVFFMVDHGSDVQPSVDAAKILSEKWQGTGSVAAYVPEFYNYNIMVKWEEENLGVHEKSEGFHDDYYTAAISVAIDPESARMPERVKIHKTSINGVELNSAKAVEDGKKIMAMRHDAAVAAIRKIQSGTK